MARVNCYSSIITLNINGSPIKKHRMAKWIKNKIQRNAAYKSLTLALKMHTDWGRRDEKGLSSNWYLKKKNTEVAIPISDKINFKLKTVKSDKESHYIMIKGSIHQEDISLV